jgi:hypothetical protein
MVCKPAYLGTSATGTAIFASITAVLIVKILAQVLGLYPCSDRNYCLEKGCITLEREYVLHRSNKGCRGIGKVEGRLLHEYSSTLWQTSNDWQTELGNGLIESLKRQHSLINPVVE